MTTHIAGTRPMKSAQRGDGRFCSTRCREAFDAGFPPAPDYSNHIRAMTDVPLSAWRIVAGPPGIEIGAQFYASVLDRKNDGRGSPPLVKKRRKFPHEINDLQGRFLNWSVAKKASGRRGA